MGDDYHQAASDLRLCQRVALPSQCPISAMASRKSLQEVQMRKSGGKPLFEAIDRMKPQSRGELQEMLLYTLRKTEIIPCEAVH